MEELRCKNCNNLIDEDTMFCPNCGTKIEKKQVSNSEIKPIMNSAELRQSVNKLKQSVSENMDSTINSVQTAFIKSTYASSNKSKPNLVLSENEIEIKKYHCASMRLQGSDGFLTITNKRVVFSGVGHTSRIEKEIVIDSISGIDTYYGSNISIAKLLLGISILFFGLINADKFGFVAFLLIVFGGFLIYRAINRTYVLAIYSSKSSLSPINLGLGATTGLGNGALLSLSARPTAETDGMMKELGALILDIQTQGDYAIEKWKH